MSGRQPDPVAAREWLHRFISQNEQALKDFYGSKVDLREQLLSEAFPYKSGPLPDQFGGLACLLLLRWAETTAGGFSFLRKIIAGLVRSREPVPEEWRCLHAGIIDGTINGPETKKNGRPPINTRRDDLLLLLVMVLQENYNLPRLANRASRDNSPLNSNGTSAIEIAADELKVVWGTIEPDAIERAVNRHDDLRAVDPIISILDRRT